MSVANTIGDEARTAGGDTVVARAAERGSRVLVMGNATMRERLQRVLSPHGFVIDGASNAVAACEQAGDALAAGQRYAVAYLAAGPATIELASELRGVDPKLHVVLCVATSEEPLDGALTALGDDAVVLRIPFDDRDVVPLTRMLARKWSLESTHDQLEDTVRVRTDELERVAVKLQQHVVDRSRMEAELRLAQKLEAVGQLAAGIAHEINTPMQYIGDSMHFLQRAFGDLLMAFGVARKACGALSEVSGHEELVRAALDAEESADVEYLERQVPRAFERTLEGVERVSTIVRALKDFAHPGQVEKSAADINKALMSAITVSRNEYKYVAEVVTELGELPPVFCHIAELNQVFLNLIINAAHAIADVVRDTDAKGTIRVRTTASNDAVRITIADTGGGIPPEVRDRVFDPFFTTKPVGKGTGQGLAIARSIVVDKHGGRLTFDSERGRGTAFTIELPVEAGQEATAP